MTTKIYKSKEDFLNRKNKNGNGVSEYFAHKHPNWEEMNSSNVGCWDCSYCSDCSDCSYCYRCYDCSYCSYCSYCSDCSDCSDKKGNPATTQAIELLKKKGYKIIKEN